MNKIKPLDFTGDTIFCGLDVHKLSWRVNIRDKDMELKDFTQPADAVILHKHLSKNYPGAHYKVGYEAGFCGFGIQRELAALGIECLVLNAADIPMMKLILTIPGIGEINAAIILFELQDIFRFKTFDNLCSYVGLIPDTDDSGDTRRNKGLTHRRNNFLREAIIESSWVLVKKDPAMLMKYKDYCKRMHKNKAIIKIARHLMARINYVLRKQTPYVSGLVAG